ncbi:MAG TPA: NFACT RNA binding domain-containing protein [Thermomicrobiales bacterium]|nr:NFACT RNA binding domain-containing protein [Thermomicrobiales bacterium]
MFDVLTVGAVVDELRRTVLDGRIQRLGMVDAVTIGAEIYAHGRRRTLIASADATNPRLHLTRSMPSLDPNLITPFGLQLRKYVRGGFLIGIEQPPLERVVRLSIAKRMAPLHTDGARDEAEEVEDAEEDDIWSGENVSRLELIVEIMGRHSNLILVDDEGLVRESAKRVTSQMSRVRPILPKRSYELPPAPGKADPRQLTSPGVEALLAEAKPDAKLADLLVRGYRGVSPQIAREVAYRVAGDAQARTADIADARAVAQAVRNMFQPLLTGDWEPHLYERDDLPVGYGAVPITHLAVDADDIALDSISEAVERAQEGEGEATPRDHAQRRARLIAAIDEATRSIDSRLRSLRQQHARADDTERLRRWGEYIYAYLWQIEPGQTDLVIEGEGETIPLDPEKSPKDVAQEYFEQYRKAQKAGDTLPERIEAAENERGYLAQLRTHAAQAEGFAAIEALRQEYEEFTGGRHAVQERTGHKSKKQATKRPTPLTDDDGNLIYIGRSGRENDQVTFDIAGPDDLWLHARGVPGSHVILRKRVPGQDGDPAAVETAAALAAYYSSGRESGTVEVDVAERRHVRKIKGGGPGMVTYRNEHTIAVRPANEDELRKAGRIE